MMSTEMISIPFSFLVLVMLGTMWRGKPWKRLPMMAVYAVVWNKVIGGITGVYLSDTPVDQYMHGSMFVVAHFHYMLMGAGLFGAMGVVSYFFPKMIGRYLDEFWGSVGFWTAFAGFQVTFMSMFVAGLQGMPRRVLQFDSLFNISNWISTVGAYVIGIGMLIFLYAIIESWRNGIIAPDNPWGGKTLENFTSMSASITSSGLIVTDEATFWRLPFAELDLTFLIVCSTPSPCTGRPSAIGLSTPRPASSSGAGSTSLRWWFASRGTTTSRFMSRVAATPFDQTVGWLSESLVSPI
jgi:heme/copper-type cytochrome/quinol oxidase subunit 1